jgi:hypothetical protein
MDHLELGTVLLRKYRIDRFRLESGGLSVYDGTDTVHAREVSIKVLERGARLGRDSRDNVVDVGRRGGSMYFVESTTPMRRVSKPPPPVPVRVPITFEEEREDEPTVIVAVDVAVDVEEPSREETTAIVARPASVDMTQEIRAMRRRPRWIALLVAAVLAAGVLVVLHLDDANAPTVTTTNAIVPIQSPEPPPTDTATASPSVTSAPSAAPTTTTSDTETRPRHTRKSAQDPLTL